MCALEAADPVHVHSIAREGSSGYLALRQRAHGAVTCEALAQLLGMHKASRPTFCIAWLRSPQHLPVSPVQPHALEWSSALLGYVQEHAISLKAGQEGEKWPSLAERCALLQHCDRPTTMPGCSVMYSPPGIWAWPRVSRATAGELLILAEGLASSAAR